MTPEEVTERRAEHIAARMTARPHPTYPLHSTLDERRLRMLAEWESIEALKMAREAGVRTPCERQTT